MECSKTIALDIARHTATAVKLGIRVLPWHVPSEMTSRNCIQKWLEACGEDPEQMGLFCGFEQVDWAAIVEALTRCPDPA